ncbi:e3 ubiquitin-protein ligase-like protein [Stylonychia lemnae]|uniref:RBR-type E3 ubiquitin transferase n=1 Tax=Stylonychia lemnae TaxID=5949 RepID=A0A078B2T5_STYLE|nr:e3 ubiquitin-protein ligase-like protein [Stylonychia lemnae]|eukprot:CDW88784.1 e3 ubiquitin-protein ligase-like protein [Stylonychia lemnae]
MSTLSQSSSSSSQKYYQIFVKGFEGRTILLNSSLKFTQNTTIRELKEAVSDRTGINFKEILLIYGTKQLADIYDNKNLKEFGIQDNSNLVMVGRLKGGVNISLKIKLLNGKNNCFLLFALSYILDEEITVNIAEESTVLELKKLIHSRKNLLGSDQMCLMCAGVKLNDARKIKLCNLKQGYVVTQSKQDLSEIPGLIISYDPDILSFDDSHEARAKMPCGHVISTESMTQFLQSLIDAKKYVIKCPAFRGDGRPCETEWDYKLCKEIGVLTLEERQKFETGFEMNMFYQQIGGKQCPFCETFVMKDINTQSTNRVRCVGCQNRIGSYDFCWICLKKWISNSSSPKHCGNPDCESAKDTNKILESCGVKIVDAIANIPVTRACPNCKTLIEHTSGCRHMTCTSPICREKKYQFCFICLQPWTGHNNSTCQVAERQKLQDKQ